MSLGGYRDEFEALLRQGIRMGDVAGLEALKKRLEGALLEARIESMSIPERREIEVVWAKRATNVDGTPFKLWNTDFEKGFDESLMMPRVWLFVGIPLRVSDTYMVMEVLSFGQWYSYGIVERPGICERGPPNPPKVAFLRTGKGSPFSDNLRTLPGDLNRVMRGLLHPFRGMSFPDYAKVPFSARLCSRMPSLRGKIAGTPRVRGVSSQGRPLVEVLGEQE